MVSGGVLKSDVIVINVTKNLLNEAQVSLAFFYMSRRNGTVLAEFHSSSEVTTKGT